MGIFDNMSFDPLSAGLLGPIMGPQGNFVGATRVGDILQSIIAGARRGAGQQDFGGQYGYDSTQPYTQQQLPSSPADLALGVNRPQYAPTLPPPVNIAMPPQGGAGVPQDAAPQIDIPQKAMLTASLGQPPVAQQQPQQAAPQASFLDRLAAGADNFANAPSILGGIAHAARGYSSGQRIDDKMQVLSDFLGNQVPYWVNPVGKTIQEAQIGSAPSGGFGIDTAGLQNAMKMPQQVDPQTGRDENFIKALGPVLGAQVISALNGDSKLDGRMLQKIQPLAARAEPGWTQQVYQQRLSAFKDFYSGGKSQITGQALNQSAGHFRELVDQMPGLPGTQMPLLNWAKNTFDTQFMGKGTANNFQVNAHALADELSRIFKQNNMSDTEIKAWESRLTPNMSQEQQRGMVRTLYGLYQEAFDALEKKRVDGLGPALAAKSAPLINGHTQGNLDIVRRFGIGGQPTQSGGLPPGWTVTVR